MQENSKQNFLIINGLFILFIILGYLYLDKTLALAFKEVITGTGIFSFGKILGSFTPSKYVRIIPFIIGLIAAIKLCNNNVNGAKKLSFVFLAFFIAYFIAWGLKFILARYRPEMLFSEGLYGFHFFSLKHEFTSFPSGHTMAAFALFIPIITLVKKRFLTVILLTIAIIIAASRVLICAHYLSDVLASIFLVYNINCYLNYKFNLK